MEERERGRERAGARATTWPRPRVRGLRGEPWPRPGEALHAAAAYLKDCAAVDFGPGRLVPWVPVAFGLGVAFYFTAEHEPSAVAAVLAFAAMAVVAFAARRRAVAFPACVLAAAVAAGFAMATLRTVRLAHPVLDRPVYGATVSGFVEAREERERTDRIVVAVERFSGARLDEPPRRVRVTVKRGAAPPVGSFVTFKARLSPPLAPLMPGGYDFARDLYFQGIGAAGFVTGAIMAETPPRPASLRLAYLGLIDAIRDGVDTRIRAAAPGDEGAIASALITGKRDAISAPVNDAMYVSSLAHVLSISGYHMAVVAGVVFFIIRAGLALIPGFSSRHPIKKWGAAGALAAAAFYLALSGAEVATQRAFAMTAIVLIGVMTDRAALTLRTLAVAALAVLLLAPEAVAHPSFQMSFAATLALVAAYEHGLPWTAGRGGSLAERAALWGGREAVALVFASLVAGLATTPYAAFHFHRAAPYGVVANLLAMPVVSAWVMPMGMLALVAMPFGFDAVFWRLMAHGISWMDAVALWVAGLPGAVGRVPAFGVGALLAATAGLVVLCLMRSRLRFAGAGLIALAMVMAATAPRPDVLVSGAGDAVAVRGPDGRLAAMRSGGDSFAVKEWLAADGDPRTPADPSLKAAFSCDAIGCVARLPDGGLVALSRAAEALAEDCAQAALVVTAREAPPGCAAKAIDRATLRARGALALRRDGQAWRIEGTYPIGGDRPWMPRARAPERASPSSHDATPRAEDLDAGD